jgi:hypothetical protein
MRRNSGEHDYKSLEALQRTLALVAPKALPQLRDTHGTTAWETSASDDAAESLGLRHAS